MQGGNCVVSTPLCCLPVFSQTAPATARGRINSQALYERALSACLKQRVSVNEQTQYSAPWRWHGSGELAQESQGNLLVTAIRGTGIFLRHCRRLQTQSDEYGEAPTPLGDSPGR